MQFEHDLDPSEPARAELIVSGRVQGVFYRQTIARAAEQGGLSGSAVNLPDGNVRVVFEGPAAAVFAAIEIARTGPPASVVADVRIEWSEPVGEQGFMTG
ncbi:MAG: acylphosphatase [Actinobacteria bacterium]|nr:acylphosphatase [Actinomycetota bacterium]